MRFIKSMLPVHVKQLIRKRFQRFAKFLNGINQHPVVLRSKLALVRTYACFKVLGFEWKPGARGRYTLPIDVAIKEFLSARRACIEDYDIQEAIDSNKHILYDANSDAARSKSLSELIYELKSASNLFDASREENNTPVICVGYDPESDFPIVNNFYFKNNQSEIAGAAAVISDNLGMCVLALAHKVPCYWISAKANATTLQKIEYCGNTSEENNFVDMLVLSIAKQTMSSIFQVIYSLKMKHDEMFPSQKSNAFSNGDLLSVYVRNHIISNIPDFGFDLPQKSASILKSLEKLQENWQSGENFSYISLALIESIHDPECVVSAKICARHYTDARSVEDLKICSIPLIRGKKFKELKICGKIVADKIFSQDLCNPTNAQTREIAQFFLCQMEINKKSYQFGHEGLEIEFYSRLMDTLIGHYMVMWASQKMSNLQISFAIGLVRIVKFYDCDAQIQQLINFILVNWDDSWKQQASNLISTLLANEIMTEHNAQTCIKCAREVSSRVGANVLDGHGLTYEDILYDLRVKMAWFAGIADLDGVSRLGEDAVRSFFDDNDTVFEVAQSQPQVLQLFCRLLTPYLYDQRIISSSHSFDLIVQFVHQICESDKSARKHLYLLLVELYVCSGRFDLASELIIQGIEQTETQSKLNLELRADFETPSNLNEVSVNTAAVYLFECWGSIPNRAHKELREQLLVRIASNILDGQIDQYFPYFSMVERFHTFDFVSESTSLLYEVKLPKKPLGVVFVLPYDISMSLAMSIPTLRILRQNGYRIVFLGKGFGEVEKTGLPLLDRFQSCISNDHRSFAFGAFKRPKQDWIIDWENKIVSLGGINYFHGFREYLTNRYRRYTMDVSNNPILSRFLDTQLQKCDIAIKICQKIYDTVAVDMPVRFIGPNAHTSPSFVYKEFCSCKGYMQDMNYVWPGQGYENYYTNLGTKVSTTLTMMNMTKRKNIRSPLIAECKDFEKWLDKNQATETDLAAVGQLTQMDRVGSSEREFEEHALVLNRIFDAKKAGQKIFVMYGKVVCDQGVPFDDGPAHRDMGDWITHTIKVAERSNILLIVKPHPHEMKREIARHLTEFFRDLMPPKLPKNVIY